MEILTELQEQKDFTETEIRIANYILAHQAELVELSISDLARAVYSSHSAVVRLAKKMGFSGYRELKLAVQKAYQVALQKTNQVNPNFPFQPADSSEKIAKQVADLSIESIRNTLMSLDYQTIEQVADLLLKAERVFLFGTGDSQLRARSFQNKFNKINRYLIIADEYGESDWSALNLRQEDLALFISYRGASQSYQKFMQYLIRKKIPTVLLTSNPASPMAQLAKLQIEVPSGELGNVKVGTFASQISFEYVLDTLFSVVFAKDYTGHLVTLKNKERILLEHFFDDEED